MQRAKAVFVAQWLGDEGNPLYQRFSVKVRSQNFMKMSKVCRPGRLGQLIRLVREKISTWYVCNLSLNVCHIFRFFRQCRISMLRKESLNFITLWN